MRKLLSAVTMLLASLGFTAQAYDCPDNVYFYVSNGASTAFDKDGTTFTYSVDATSAAVYGVIVDANVTDWNGAHAATAYFASGYDGSSNLSISGTTVWNPVGEKTSWSSGCLEFAEGKVYDIKFVYSDGAFTASFTVEGEDISTFETGKDYYIDPSACEWATDAGAIFKVNDGNTDVACETLSDGILKWTATNDALSATVKRINPSDGTTVWNSFTMSAPTDAAYNLFTTNSSFSGGSWGTYDASSVTIPDAWLISSGINSWDAKAMSDYVMTYDEATGLYTVSVDPALLIADGDSNGFKVGYNQLNNWNLYYGATGTDAMSNGVATSAVQGSTGNNFIVPAEATNPVTLVLNVSAKTLTASWTEEQVDPEEPVDPDPEDPEDPEDPDPENPDDPEPDVPAVSDNFAQVSVPTMDVNGSATVEMSLAGDNADAYCAAQFTIELPEGFTLNSLTLNAEACPSHVLVTNPEDLSEGVSSVNCIIYSGKNELFAATAASLFSFDVTATDAAVGEATGKLTGIILDEKPYDENLNVGHSVADVEFTLNVVKAVTSITATPANLTLTAGESSKIELTILPEDATNQEVKWEITSGEDLISLANDGTVIANATGVAVITVTALDGFGASTEINVTIDGKPVESITISAEEAAIYIGETVQLSATVAPDDATNQAIQWLTSDESIATVSEDGLVTGVSAGVATITAVARGGENVEASCEVTVKAKVSGDADGDDQLTIADIVIIAKKSVGIDTEGMHLENMDMDADGSINSTDVVLAVYYLNLQDASEDIDAQLTTNKLDITTPVPLSATSFNLPVYLPMAKEVAGLKFDVVLPEGLELTTDSYIAPEASNGHDVAINKVADRTWRVIVYSPYNFKSNALGYLNILNNDGLQGKVDMYINNVTLSDGNTLYATDDDVHTIEIIVSSIESVFADGDSTPKDVYNVSGALVARQADAARVATLPAGIYIVGSQKVAKF